MALANAERFVQAGADGIKLEGPAFEVIDSLVKHGYHACAHLGLTPQFHKKFRLKAANADDAHTLLDHAVGVQEAGASMLVLELVPEEVAEIITDELCIPTIGIGAGRYTSGQVQVVHDLLGFTSTTFRHAGRYSEAGSLALEAIRSYRNDVEKKAFPTESQARHISKEELELFVADLGLK
jgi:3-methyl-2-oxobutanoate hydroxymethyltransferase